jgi:hypothetical protein
MIAPKLYPFHSLLWEDHIWFTPISTGMLMGHRTSPGCGNLQHCILYLFLELFLTALYFRVAYRPTFRACDPFMQVPYVTECPLEGYGNIRPFHEWGGYMLWMWGSNFPCWVALHFLNFFPVWGEHSVNHEWICSGEDTCQVCGHRPLLHLSTMGLAQEWTPPR